MIMGIPLFLLFCVYGVVNAYLPILLFLLGYSPTLIGILQGIFDAAGLIFPIFISSRVDAKGNYGITMILCGAIMAVMPPLLIYVRNFWISAFALAVFAIGFKGAVPVSDALISRMLGTSNTNYGKIRVTGSIGFVFITLFLQITQLINTTSAASIALWLILPAFLFSLSVIVIPRIRSPMPQQKTDGFLLRDDTVERAQKKNSSTMPLISSLYELPAVFWAGILLIFLGFLGMTPSQRFFSLYVQEYLHLNSYAGLWALSAAAEVPFMFISGRFIRRFGTVRILAFSLLAVMMRNLIYAIFPTFTGAVAGQLFHSVCFGLFHPAAIVFVTESVPKRLTTVGMTLYTSVAVGFASVIGNVIGGIIIDTLGYRLLFVVFAGFPLIGILFFLILRDRLYRLN